MNYFFIDSTSLVLSSIPAFKVFATSGGHDSIITEMRLFSLSKILFAFLIKDRAKVSTKDALDFDDSDSEVFSLFVSA